MLRKAVEATECPGRSLIKATLTSRGREHLDKRLPSKAAETNLKHVPTDQYSFRHVPRRCRETNFHSIGKVRYAVAICFLVGPDQ